MKIVKRDGRTVEYDANKIRIAINKANDEVLEQEKISDTEIENIIKYIESLDKKRMLVEDIQDIIEEKLMNNKKFHLAKIYIIYRYTRSIIRKSNTIDASILSVLKNRNFKENNYLDANTQRDVMAGEVSKDLAYRLLLPKNVVESERDNRIKFCNVEYFTEPIIESAKIKLSDMLENGTVINNIKIESPKSFQSACNILVEIVSSIASAQTGNIYIDLKDLFKYYDLTFEKNYDTYSALMKSEFSQEQIRAFANTQSFMEVKTGIQTILYQINTITIRGGTVPKVHFLIDTRNIQSSFEERIVYEFIRQKMSGIKDENGTDMITEYPKIVYSIPSEDDKLKYEYITKELFNSNLQFIYMNQSRYDSFLKELDKFNQGSMIINIARLALNSVSIDGRDFFELLEENLDYCYEGLRCRNHNLQGIYSDISPIHWQFGAISRLDKSERIDPLLKRGLSHMTLIVYGLEASVTILGKEVNIKKRIVDFISEKVKSWNKESSFETIISNDGDDSILREIFMIDSPSLKKYNISSYRDSREFISSDYFKNGYITIKDSSDDEIYNLQDKIIIKDSPI